MHVLSPCRRCDPFSRWFAQATRYCRLLRTAASPGYSTDRLACRGYRSDQRRIRVERRCAQPAILSGAWIARRCHCRSARAAGHALHPNRRIHTSLSNDTKPRMWMLLCHSVNVATATDREWLPDRFALHSVRAHCRRQQSRFTNGRVCCVDKTLHAARASIDEAGFIGGYQGSISKAKGVQPAPSAHPSALFLRKQGDRATISKATT